MVEASRLGPFARSRVLLSGAALGVLALAPVSAQAQAAQASTDEIIVTATKREQSLQDIPLSVTALDGDVLEAQGAREFDDYATLTPNLSFGYSGEGRQTGRRFQLRGIFGNDTSALYIGDTAVPVTVDPRVIDLERVEVLRGPQGSLFGARSMGGLVRLVPKGPSDDAFSGKVHAAYGAISDGASDYAADGTVNIPLGQGAAMRATVYFIRDGGFIDRLIDPDASFIAQPLATTVPVRNGDERLNEDINEDETIGGQLSFTFSPTPNFSLTPRILYQRTESTGPNYVDNQIDNFLKVRQFDVQETGEDRWGLASLEAAWTIPHGELVSSTSYFDRETLDIEDSTLFMGTRLGGRVRAGVAAPATTRQVLADKRVTQELRYVSAWEGRSQIVAGVFYQDLDQEGGFPVDTRVPVGSQLINLFGSGVVVGDSFFSLDTSTQQQEAGVFGEIEFALTPELKLVAGGRYFNVETTQSRKDGGVLFTKFGGIIAGVNIDPPRTTATQTEDGFNPRFAATWEPNSDVTLYANAARGFRPGRINATANACAALGVTVPASVASDSLWNYEGGGKFRFFNGRASLNTAAYYIVWKDRQTQTFNCGGLGFGAQENVGEAESKGGEVELAAELFPGMNLSAGVGYTQANVTDRGKVTSLRNGQRLANVPLWNGAVALDFDQPVSDGIGWFGGLDLRYVGASISAQNNRRPEYWLANARVGLKSGGWRLSVFGQNLGNEQANLADPPELSDALNLIAVSRPRTIGVDLRRSF